ncbi:uncharacterized protein LOC134177659 [Corticium candelabrum]|uniref:uncharacterized protein LOC134177659 n=1 Tax=Corticium candelabrum TaxID=121492 RepID=UPI002E2715F9|nr:uncharacterized protein LOC134177659 [Corticium candelabrum]
MRKIFRLHYSSLRVVGVTKEYDGVRVRYTARLENSTSFHSGTATLRIAELPTVSRHSRILVGELGSIFEACFKVTGSPKPSLRVNKEGNDNISSTVSTNTTRNCVYFGPLQLSDAGNVTVTAENCYGKSNFTLYFQIFQKPSSSPTTIYCSRNITQYEAHTTQLSTTNNIQAQQIQNHPTDVFGSAANTFILRYNGRTVASSESKITVSVNSTLTMQYTVTNPQNRLHVCHNEKATDRVFDCYPFLIIPNVQQSDSGMYEIIARNRDVNMRLYFKLQVKASPSTVDTSATPSSHNVFELRDTSEKIEVWTTAVIVASVCIFVFALPTAFLVYKYRQRSNLLTRRLDNSNKEETGEPRSPTTDSNVEGSRQTAIFTKSEETVSLVNPTANPTAACGDAVYESCEENQVRQVTAESSHDLALDIAVQDNAAYGATV